MTEWTYRRGDRVRLSEAGRASGKRNWDRSGTFAAYSRKTPGLVTVTWDGTREPDTLRVEFIELEEAVTP